jgi:hypothetical protein
MRKLALALLASALTLAALTGSASAGPPGEICNYDHRMDVAWVNGQMYECRCIRFRGEERPWCSWFKVPPARATRPPKKAKPKLIVTKSAGSVGVIAPPALSASPPPPAPAPVAATGKCNDPYLADDAWAQANGC